LLFILAVIAQETGLRTVLIDLDPQRSAAGWWDTRAAPTPELVETSPDGLRAVLEAAQADGVDLRVVDTPSAGANTAAAAALADLVLIPTRPSIFDLRAIGATVEIVAKARAPAFIVLNTVPAPRGAGLASVTSDARRILAAEYAVPLAPVAIGQRVAMAHALIDGRAVNEFDPHGKAAREMTLIWQLVEAALWPSDLRLAR
jgi:chromosome partitioning protein